MGGEHRRGDPQVPDYAGKDSGVSGGPGGHARERLDELLAQRLPADNDAGDNTTDDDTADHDPTHDLASTNATAYDDLTQDDPTEDERTTHDADANADAQPHDELADEPTDREPADAGEDEPH